MNAVPKINLQFSSSSPVGLRARRQQRIAELEARVAELEAENQRLRKAAPVREPGWEPGTRVRGIMWGFNSSKKYFVVEDPGPLGDGDRKVKVQQHPIGNTVIVLGSEVVMGWAVPAGPD